MYLFFCLRALGIGIVSVFLTACFNAQSGSLIHSTDYSKPTFDLSEVTSFDVTGNNGKIHALVAGKFTKKDSRVAVRYLSSDDGGAHWTTAINVVNDANLIAVRGNDIQIAGAGTNLVAIWQTTGELPNMGPMVTYYSHDSGITWHAGSNPAVDNNGDQSHIDMIVDAKGVFHVVWLADPEENGYQSLRYARSLDGGEHWQASLKLDDSTCSCCWNTLAVSPAGVLSVLYRDMKPRDMALMQSSDQGVTWRHAGMVGDFKWQFDGCPHVGGGLAVVDEDTLYSTVWTGVEDRAGLYTLRSGNNGKRWSAPQALGGLASHSDIAANKQRVVVVWDERGPDGSSIFSAQSQDGGISWSTPTRLSSAGIMATHPRITLTSHGFLAMWTEKQSKQPGQWVVKILE